MRASVKRGLKGPLTFRALKLYPALVVALSSRGLAVPRVLVVKVSRHSLVVENPRGMASAFAVFQKFENNSRERLDGSVNENDVVRRG